MIVKILGTIDILAAIFLWIFGLFHVIPDSIILFFVFLLLIKGVIFLISMDFASIGDLVCCSIMFYCVYFPTYEWIIIVTSFYLLQKGVFSWL